MAQDTTQVTPYESNTTNPKVINGQLVPRRAIGSARQASSIGDRLVLDDVGRDKRRATLDSAIQGNAPFSTRALREKNQGHRFNISVGYLEGALGRAYAPYLDMGLDEEFLARIKADLDETKKNIVRELFVKTVRRWGEWGVNYNDLVSETVNYGYCTAVFPNKGSPWWHAVRQRAGLTFARSKNIASKLDVFVWKRSYLIHELYDHVEDVEAAKLAGWNVENVWEALQSAAPDDYTKNRLMGGRQVYEEAIRAAALAMSYGTGAKKVDTYHVYCKELSGKVSQWIVLDTSSTNGYPQQGSDPDIHLFYQFEMFDSIEEVITRFDLEHGDGNWHGSKGLAQKLFGVHCANDRMFCSGLDQMFRGGLGLLKSTSQKAHEAANITVNSDFVVLGPDVDAVPGAKMPTLDTTFFSMNAALLATAVQRGGDVAPEAMGIERSAKTATQAGIDQGNKQIVTKSNLKRWVRPLAKVIDQMLMRLLNAESGDPDAIQFVTALIDKGLTQEDIAKIKGAEVFHSVEDVFGETKQNVSMIADKYRNDPDCDRLELKKREVGIWLGPQASLELIPGDADQLSQLKASRLQTLEISAILDGNAVPVAPDDLHPVHVQTIINEFNHIAELMVSGKTSTKRAVEDQDIVNLHTHATEHIAEQAKTKGARESARMLEQALEQSLAKLTEAKSIVQQRHAQALQQGIEAGIRDGSQGTASQQTPPQSSAPGQTSPMNPAAMTPPKVIESINFKDLPPSGQSQLARQAGIDISPDEITASKEADKPQPSNSGVMAA